MKLQEYIKSKGETWFSITKKLIGNSNETEFLPKRHKDKRKNNPRIKEAYEMRKSGKSLRKIGATLDVSHITIRDWLNNYEEFNHMKQKIIRYLKNDDITLSQYQLFADALEIPLKELLSDLGRLN